MMTEYSWPNHNQDLKLEFLWEQRQPTTQSWAYCSIVGFVRTDLSKSVPYQHDFTHFIQQTYKLQQIVTISINFKSIKFQVNKIEQRDRLIRSKNPRSFFHMVPNAIPTACLKCDIIQIEFHMCRKKFVAPIFSHIWVWRTYHKLTLNSSNERSFLLRIVIYVRCK